ncbi:MAG TPA: hypothetical protein VFM98_14435 [Ramlibacter sp.]|uniref:hypothetical protein n=1 Tax=Ramlibacter sp. TaxID=1917967 RepID=UPI002D809DEF|nr:hypothetical protein [Ramlibacter sp.]HET8746801.1 hypothetical protein [Ramlibacter sp.]
MPLQTWRAGCALAAAILLCACAAEVPVAHANLVPLTAPAPDLQLASDLPVSLSTGYTRTVPAKTRWRAVGALPQGTVYRPLDTVFAIEGRQIHEAYLVVRGTTLQGFFLPGEGNYSALPSGIQLPIETGERR